MSNRSVVACRNCGGPTERHDNVLWCEHCVQVVGQIKPKSYSVIIDTRQTQFGALVAQLPTGGDE